MMPPSANRPPRSRPDELTPPTRRALEGLSRQVIKAGGPTKADLYAVDGPEGPLVVKDFAAKAWWVRWIGRVQVARECGAYRWLGSLPGVPRFLGRIDGHALALERVQGTLLAHSPRRYADGRELLGRLRQVVQEVHATGLVHLDLRGHENVMLDHEGRIYLLDFAGALWMRPGGSAHRWLFPRLQAADEAALLKWKRLLAAGEYTMAEQQFLARYGFWRSLWVFNRKRRRRKPG